MGRLATPCTENESFSRHGQFSPQTEMEETEMGVENISFKWLNQCKTKILTSEWRPHYYHLSLNTASQLVNGLYCIKYC